MCGYFLVTGSLAITGRGIFDTGWCTGVVGLSVV